MTPVLALALAAGCLLAAACGVEGDAAEVDGHPRFQGAAPSVEELGREVLDALTRRDTVALQRVRLTEHEHNDVVWPELPASAPALNFPVDYAWTNIENRDRRSVGRLFPMYDGRKLGFEGVECRGETERFETFEVETDCWVVFVTTADAKRWEAQLFKDVLVRGGGYKIFRYYDEEPRPYRGPTAP